MDSEIKYTVTSSNGSKPNPGRSCEASTLNPDAEPWFPNNHVKNEFSNSAENKGSNNRDMKTQNSPVVGLKNGGEVKRTGYHELPDEILEKIFSQLSLLDIAKIRLVCERWENASRRAKIALKLSSDPSEGELLPNRKTLRLLASTKLRKLIFSVELGADLEENKLERLLPLLKKCDYVREFRIYGPDPIHEAQNLAMLSETVVSFGKTLETFHMDPVNMMGDVLFPRNRGPLPSKIKRFSTELRYNKGDIIKIIRANKETLETVEIEFYFELQFEEEIFKTLSQTKNLKKLSILADDLSLFEQIFEYFGKINENTESDASLKVPKIIAFELRTNFCQVRLTKKKYPYIEKLFIVKHCDDHCQDHWEEDMKEHENMNTFKHETAKRLKNFPNVKFLRLAYHDEKSDVVSSNVVKIVSKFEKLEELQIYCPWDEKELDIFLLAFDRSQTLRTIEFQIDDSSANTSHKWVKLARSLTAEGQRTTIVKKDSNHCMIVEKKKI